MERQTSLSQIQIELEALLSAKRNRLLRADLASVIIVFFTGVVTGLVMCQPIRVHVFGYYC